MRRCRKCSSLFEPVRPLQVVCSLACSLAWAKTQAAQRAEKALRAAVRREDRKRIATPSEAARKAQAQFNKWVRLMDRGMPCVSCGAPDDGSRQRHASHYRPAGPNPALRFEPDNVHAACSICNNHKSGNLTPYRIELIRRIGIERVEWLEGHHDLPHRTVADFRAIEADFRKRIRAIEKTTNEGHPHGRADKAADPLAASPRRDDPPVHSGDGAAVTA